MPLINLEINNKMLRKSTCIWKRKIPLNNQQVTQKEKWRLENTFLLKGDTKTSSQNLWDADKICYYKTK